VAKRWSGDAYSASDLASYLRRSGKTRQAIECLCKSVELGNMQVYAGAASLITDDNDRKVKLLEKGGSLGDEICYTMLFTHFIGRDAGGPKKAIRYLFMGKPIDIGTISHTIEAREPANFTQQLAEAAGRVN
jgi:hypothetical protein